MSARDGRSTSGTATPHRAGDVPALQLVDRLQEIAELSKRLHELEAKVQVASARRRDIVVELHASGYSHAQLAEAMNLSRGRVFQILRAEERAAAHEDVET